MGLLGLFLSALIAATLFPAQSEAVLTALIVYGNDPLWILWWVATFGNVLGAVINWGIGRWGFAWMRARLSIASTERLERVEHWYVRWGWMSLLASWVPVIGDPLTCVAGAMREPLWRFLMVVTVAKGGRYAVLIGAVSSLQALSP